MGFYQRCSLETLGLGLETPRGQKGGLGLGLGLEVPSLGLFNWPWSWIKSLGRGLGLLS